MNGCPRNSYSSTSITSLLGVAARPIGVLLGWKGGLEDRLEHLHSCCHAHPNAGDFASMGLVDGNGDPRPALSALAP
jgi:hypothetical protein